MKIVTSHDNRLMTIGQKSVTYYLNGPLINNILNFNTQYFVLCDDSDILFCSSAHSFLYQIILHANAHLRVSKAFLSLFFVTNYSKVLSLRGKLTDVTNTSKNSCQLGSNYCINVCLV
jgi:hypothetical protein